MLTTNSSSPAPDYRYPYRRLSVPLSALSVTLLRLSVPLSAVRMLLRTNSSSPTPAAHRRALLGERAHAQWQGTPPHPRGWSTLSGHVRARNERRSHRQPRRRVTIRVACCTLHVARCVLHAACCNMLHAACCTAPAATPVNLSYCAFETRVSASTNSHSISSSVELLLSDLRACQSRCPTSRRGPE